MALGNRKDQSQSSMWVSTQKIGEIVWSPFLPETKRDSQRARFRLPCGIEMC